MIRAGAVALVLLGGVGAANAQPVPQPVAADPRIVSIPYDPDSVVPLTGALGWQLMIEFGRDERIENVSIGDALAWQVTPNRRANLLFLKPLAKGAATNMTVVTNNRRYAFALATGPRRASTPWVLRFDYPRPVVETLPEPPPPPQPKLNFSYQQAGDAGIQPARVWDDGRQTYFEFPEGASLPAIFAGGPGRDEALVNMTARGRVSIVQQLGSRFTLRLGKRTATVTRLAAQ